MSKVSISGGSIEEIANQIVDGIERQLPSRCYRSANELRNSAFEILSGQGSGRKYGKHTASAPGSPPAVKSGAFRASWQPKTFMFGTSYISRIESSGLKYAGWLEHGTPGGQMAPRPHHDRIANHAEPRIVGIYDEPYF